MKINMSQLLLGSILGLGGGSLLSYKYMESRKLLDVHPSYGSTYHAYLHKKQLNGVCDLPHDYEHKTEKNGTCVLARLENDPEKKVYQLFDTFFACPECKKLSVSESEVFTIHDNKLSTGDMYNNLPWFTKEDKET